MELNIFGIIFLAFNVLVFIIGFARQIWLNHKEKTVKGLSISAFSLSVFVTAVWLGYGLSIQDLYITIPNIVGMIACVIALIQMAIYRDFKRDKFAALSFVFMAILILLGVWKYFGSQSMVIVFGLVAGIANWGLAFLGHGHQAWLNYKQGVKNLSLLLYFTIVAMFAFAILYGNSVGIKPLVWGNVAALVLTSLVLGQILAPKGEQK
ncbi:hypothetical protein HY227_02375 [Candidatus Wolfebacteria bacterium]|nr:hypothetical protein [Candidatus Wolfebacteria bacterium]